MVKVSRCMSTQHPDNVSMPFFADSEVLSGNAEVKEAYYVFSQLGCKEQMWDSEGKEVDNQVVEKLLSRYTDFFTKNTLGKDIYLTYRAPNPAIQPNQAKVLLEVLHSIPRAFDVARALNTQVAPIFEVILPMTTNARELERIRTYYEKIVVGHNNTRLIEGDITMKEWVGETGPDGINVIPLFENYESFLNIEKIVEEYLNGKRMEYQRIFLARSDPALNYGSVNSVLLVKRALMKLEELEQKLSIDILPILGVGGSPFRGNFKPTNVENCASEYPSVQTFTAQSSFKYDYSFRDVINSIDMLNSSKRKPAQIVDEEKLLMHVDKIQKEYQEQLSELADLINAVSTYVPSRRSRTLHVGLFGYSRSFKGIQLPRAIKFCASLYSIGVPPELLGLSALNEKELDDIREFYVKIDEDLKESVQYLNKSNLEKLPTKVRDGIRKVLHWIDYEENEEHSKSTGKLLTNIQKGHTLTMKEDIEHAAWIRHFLG